MCAGAAEKVRVRHGWPSKDEVRPALLTDISYVRAMEGWMVTTRSRWCELLSLNVLPVAGKLPVK
ncbi:TPA: hypothetical protein N1541_004718 [Salmonella enterica subsp. enterica serovar Infantis]|nr:hypothetical protein [Salmonella enterica subsp. enterica serovar Infantis]